MKKFLGLLAIVVMLGAFTSAYAQPRAESYPVKFQCKHCGDVLYKYSDVRGYCKASPNHKHNFVSVGRWHN